MSSEIQTPSKSHNKKKHADDRTSSKKRKRDTKETADLATPSAAKRIRRADEDATALEPTNSPSLEDNTQDATATNDTSESSPFFTQTSSFYLALSPIGQSKPLESLCAEHLSPLILTYYPPLNGVVLSYQNARLSNSPLADNHGDSGILARSVDEYAVSYIWVTADFTILQPKKGIWIEGHVSVQSESHLGLVCWNLFNASIDSKRLPKKWRWVGGSAKDKRRQTKGAGGGGAATDEDEDGHFVDAEGEKIEGVVKFRVRDFENLADFGRDKGFMSIEGSLLTEEEEAKAAREEIHGGGRGGRDRSRTGRTRERSMLEVS